MEVQGIWSSLQSAAGRGSQLAADVLRSWEESVAVDGATEDFLGVAVMTFADCAVGGDPAAAAQGGPAGELELAARREGLLGVEQCLCLGLACLPPDALGRLQESVVERTLAFYDPVGDALAALASQQLLMPGAAPGPSVEGLLVVLTLLLRCVGADRLTGREVLDLTRGDAALAVALLTEALAKPAPAGIPQWHLRAARWLQQLTAMDSCVFLIQRVRPDMDFNNTSIEELHQRHALHCHVLAASFVQFDTLDRSLKAAESPEQRQPIVTSLLRALHTLVSSFALDESGKILSRSVALDFSRIGFRFVAPLVRKVLDAGRTTESAKFLRMTCRTFSWLLVHGEGEGQRFLAETLRPLASEWTMRCHGVGATPVSVMALLGLAASCGALSPDWPGSAPLLTQLPDITQRLQAYEMQSAGGPSPWRACLGPVTIAGSDALLALGFAVPEQLCADEEEEEEEEEEGEDEFVGGLEDYTILGGTWDDLEDEDFEAHGMLQEHHDVVCTECGRAAAVGNYGEGYFASLWYCQRCWSVWQRSPPEQQGLNPLTAECDAAAAASPVFAVATEQRGAARALLLAPGRLRCGISGRLLVESPVRVPGSADAASSVAFERRSLERWQRRSKGRCPITGRPLDMREVFNAPDLLQEVAAWLPEALAAL